MTGKVAVSWPLANGELTATPLEGAAELTAQAEATFMQPEDSGERCMVTIELLDGMLAEVLHEPQQHASDIPLTQDWDSKSCSGAWAAKLQRRFWCYSGVGGVRPELRAHLRGVCRVPRRTRVVRGQRARVPSRWQ